MQHDPRPALPSPSPRELVHKLNNLLTVVMGHAETAGAGDDIEEMRRALEIIAGASHSMAEHVRTFARLNAMADQAERRAGRSEGQ